MRRMMLNFDEDELNALTRLAEAEHRDIKQQASFLIRKQLEAMGLIKSIVTPTPQDTPGQIIEEMHREEPEETSQ